MARKSNLTKRTDGSYKRSIVIGRGLDGKPIRKYIYGKTIKEVDFKISEYHRNLRMGTLSTDENATFGEVAHDWITRCKPLIAEKQKKRYQSIIDTHLKELSGLRLRDLKPMHLQVIINQLATDGRSQKTLSTIKQTAVQIIDLAMQNDIVYRNAFSKVVIPHIESEDRMPITDQQRQLITQSWEGHKMGLGAVLMLFCGLRRGELIALTWRDIDIKAGTITINKTATSASNRCEIKQPKTKAGVRVVPIPTIILSSITKAKKTDSMMVCPSANGSMLTLQAYKRSWTSFMRYLNIQAGGKDATKNHLKVIAMQPFTAHQLRHTYASMIYDAGVDVKSAQELLGHSDLQITLKIYTHLSNNKKQQAIDALDQHFSKNFCLKNDESKTDGVKMG